MVIILVLCDIQVVFELLYFTFFLMDSLLVSLLITSMSFTYLAFYHIEQVVYNFYL